MTDELDQILARINYDPRAELGAADRATLLRPDPIPWPAGLAPKRIGGPAADDEPLPKADVLVIAYTTAEGHALADVLTPGSDTTSWTEYRNGWAALKAMITGDRAPSLQSNRAGLWALTAVGSKRVVVVKSDLHPSTDGRNLPMRALWTQMIDQVRPELVITTGTAGGIGADTVLGDVLVTNRIKTDCTGQFKHEPYATELFTGPEFTPGEHLTNVGPLMAINAARLKPTATRDPIVYTTGDVISCDSFLFDDAENHFGLRTYDPAGRMEEMDEFALGLAVAGTPQRWLSIRDASDPQVPQMATIDNEDKWAGKIYERLGYWTAIGSSVVCWAVIADLE